MLTRTATVVVAMLAATSSAFAEVEVDAEGDVADEGEVAEEAVEAEPDPELDALEAKLRYQTGTIALPSGRAALELPDGYRYLDPASADLVLQSWGNPPDPHTDGMIVPSTEGPAGDAAWVVVVTYVDDGHVDDSDAASIDYDELLAAMQRDTIEENRERERLGLATVVIEGWAESPRYDAATHKLYWAKELQFTGQELRTLNYAVRVLGREGILELNAVATMDQLADVTIGMREVLGFSEFTAGHRYEDYRPGTDRDAGYGIATVVAGSAVAAKAAGSKGLVAALLAAKKLLALIGLGILGLIKVFWSRIRRVFRRGSKEPAASSPPPPPPPVEGTR